MYVCNCNGIRQRDVLLAVESGATMPAQIFHRHGCKAQCGRCVGEMQSFLTCESNKMALAAE
jgi:bacterioferritin-associated ferredoxin